MTCTAGDGAQLRSARGVSEAMFARLDRLHERSGRKVNLVGWSLGSVYAPARRRPAEAVRRGHALGSPLVSNPRSSNAWRLYGASSGKRVDDPRRCRMALPCSGLPMTSIYSHPATVSSPGRSEPAACRWTLAGLRSSHTGLGGRYPRCCPAGRPAGLGRGPVETRSPAADAALAVLPRCCAPVASARAASGGARFAPHPGLAAGASSVRRVDSPRRCSSSSSIAWVATTSRCRSSAVMGGWHSRARRPSVGRIATIQLTRNPAPALARGRHRADRERVHRCADRIRSAGCRASSSNAAMPSFFA